MNGDSLFQGQSWLVALPSVHVLPFYHVAEYVIRMLLFRCVWRLLYHPRPDCRSGTGLCCVHHGDHIEKRLFFFTSIQWLGTGRIKNIYCVCMCVCMFVCVLLKGLGANLPQDAVYVHLSFCLYQTLFSIFLVCLIYQAF